MYRLLFPFPLIALLSADIGDEHAKKDLKRFEGTWKMVEGHRDGIKLSDEHVKGSKIVWMGTEMIVDVPNQTKEQIKAKITNMNAGKKPAEFDFVRSTGPEPGKTWLAIYEFVGDDGYQIAFSPPGKGRPQNFTSPSGSGIIHHVWKRGEK